MSTSLICSFCGKAESDLVRIVPGPTVYICNECVGIASEHLRATEIKVRPALDAALVSSAERAEASIADHAIALLKAAKKLVEAERAERSASLAVREAHRKCDHSYGCCTSRACIDAENALNAAVRAEFQAQKEALAELRKLAETNAMESIR